MCSDVSICNFNMFLHYRLTKTIVLKSKQALQSNVTLQLAPFNSAAQ